MKVAISVKDNNLTFFTNAGHTPYFAVYNIKGSGMFKSFELEEVRKNPRTDLTPEEQKEGHQCSHDENANQEAHIKEHNKLGEVIQDCNFLVTKKACKNTANAITKYGVSIKKYNGEIETAPIVLNRVAGELNN